MANKRKGVASLLYEEENGPDRIFPDSVPTPICPDAKHETLIKSTFPWVLYSYLERQADMHSFRQKKIQTRDKLT